MWWLGSVVKIDVVVERYGCCGGDGDTERRFSGGKGE